MKKKIAALLAAGMLSASVLPVAHADIVATLNMSWDNPPVELESGTDLVAAVEWDANYAHGFLDGAEETSTVFGMTVTGGYFLDLPEQCGEGSSLEATSLRCEVITPDDDGIAGRLAVPVRAWGAHGESVSVSVTDSHVNTASTTPLPITARGGIDIALNENGLTAHDYRFDPTVEANTTLPIMVAVPHGTEPLIGEVAFNLEFATETGPDILDNATINVVPVPSSAAVMGIAANTDSYPLPDVEITRISDTVLGVVAHVPGTLIPPTHDPVGDLLDTIPVMSFALELSYPVYSPDLDNTAMSWTATVSTVEAQTQSFQITDQIRTANDKAQTSFVSEGSVSAKFVNGHAPSAGGILAEPGDDPEKLPSVHRDVWDPEQGTGTLSAGATNWRGRGPILPGDQMVGTVDSAHYLGHGPSDYEPGTTHGYCLVFDREGGTTSYNGRYSVTQLSTYEIEYLTGAMPGGFASPDCGAGTWTSTQPDDVTAVRILFDPAEQDSRFTGRPIFGAGYLASPDLQEGQRAWMAGGHSLDVTDSWNTTGSVVAEAPGYGNTTTFRDAVEAVPYRTSVRLSTESTTVSPGEEVTWQAQTLVSAAPFADRGTHDVEHRLTLPAGIEYVSSDLPIVVTHEGGHDVLTWNAPIDVGTPKTADITTVYRTGTGTLTATISVENMTSERLRTDSDFAEVLALAAGGTYLSKTTEANEFAVDGSNKWTIDLENRDSFTIDVADTIDILPYEGDGRGTVTSAQTTVTEITGEEAWVTTADPATISPDPLDTSNGTVGEPSDIWEPWDGQDNVTAVRWISTEIAPGQTATYSILYRVDGASHGDVLVNSAQSRTRGAVTTMINSSSTSTVGTPANLQVDKRLIGHDAALAEGEELTFEITVRGAGPGVVRGATLVDLPIAGLADVMFIDASQGTFSGNLWNIGDLAENEIVSATVTAVATGGPVTNMVVGETCIEDCVPVQPEVCEPNVDVYSDTDRCDLVELTEAPILQVDKSFTGELPLDGDVFFDITVRNGATPADGVVTTATDVELTDLLGEGLAPGTLTFHHVSHGSASKDVWSIGTLYAEQEVTARVSAEIIPGSQRVVNAVSVYNPALPRELLTPEDALPNADVYTDTDQADVVDVRQDGKLAINKELNSIDGDTITYTVEVGNLGGTTITDVTMVDIPGDGLHDATLHDPTVGSVDGLTWVVGDLVPGQVEHISVTARLEPAIGHVVNEAYVEGEGFPHEGTFVPNPTLETDTDQGDAVATDIPTPDLRLVKHVRSIDGTTAHFDIEVCNVGTGPATAVTVTDGGGPTIESLDSDDERFTNGTFVLGTLHAGDCHTLAVSAQITGSGTNVAYVDSPDDPLDENANQRNNTIEDDIDGWDEVDFEAGGAGPTPGTPALPLTGPTTGILIIGALLLIGLGAGAIMSARRS